MGFSWIFAHECGPVGWLCRRPDGLAVVTGHWASRATLAGTTIWERTRIRWPATMTEYTRGGGQIRRTAQQASRLGARHLIWVNKLSLKSLSSHSNRVPQNCYKSGGQHQSQNRPRTRLCSSARVFLCLPLPRLREHPAGYRPHRRPRGAPRGKRRPFLFIRAA